MPQWTEPTLISNINSVDWMQWAVFPQNILLNLSRNGYPNIKKLNIKIKTHLKFKIIAITNRGTVSICHRQCQSHKFRSQIPLFYWCHRHFVKHKIPSMTQFEYLTLKSYVPVVVNGKVLTINSNLVVVNTCLIAMYFDKVMSDLQENLMLRLKFSIEDQCNI